MVPEARPNPTRLLRMRDFIHKSLYSSGGYFCDGSGPILPQLAQRRSDFANFPTRQAYQESVASRFRQASQSNDKLHGWLTPVELFSPFLSRAIANRLYESRERAADPLHILEIGGGSGVLCSDIMVRMFFFYFCLSAAVRCLLSLAILHHLTFCFTPWYAVCGEFRQDFLGDRCEVNYTIVEISPTLASNQRRLLEPWVASKQVRIVCEDVISYLDTLLPGTESPSFHVIACEVLDNLAHDLVQSTPNGDLRQAFVEMDSGTPSIRWETPVEDEVMSTLRVWDLLNPVMPKSYHDRLLATIERAVSAGSQDYWVPVQAHRLLQGLALRHSMVKSLTIMDFSSFPGALPGSGAPVVQRVDQDGSARVYPSIVGAPFGKCDIMFPVAFERLEQAFWHCFTCRNGVSSVISQQDFFGQFAAEGDVERSTCRDGYNPVLTEFSNAHVFMANVTS